jgi:hypothetical protein
MVSPGLRDPRIESLQTLGVAQVSLGLRDLGFHQKAKFVTSDRVPPSETRGGCGTLKGKEIAPFQSYTSQRKAGHPTIYCTS